MPTSTSTIGQGSSLWATLLGVVVCVGVVLLLAYLFTRYIAVRGFGSFSGGQSGFMRVVYRAPLGRGKQLLVVSVGKRWLLLGDSGDGITLLAELSQEDIDAWKAWESTRTEKSIPPTLQSSFYTMLQRKRKGSEDNDQH